MGRRVLFVCSGNICRSPLAEAVFRHKLAERGLAGHIVVDSAGTVTDHLGQQADPRMRRTAGRRGISISHRARRVRARDLHEFDLIVGMDDLHLATLHSMADGHGVEIRKMREFDPVVPGDAPGTAPDVPDPWYGGMDGFEEVFEMVERSCERLVDVLTGDSAPNLE